MEIRSIEICNFQSHVKTIIEPAPAGKLTVIVGPSDSGKTSIIRALRWLFYNVPQGAEFINVKASAARVVVDYTGGRRIVRERHRRNYNRYAVDEQKFEGFGSGVPLEVQEATGVRPVTIGDLEFNLNLAEQLDGPFLGKSVSAGARAKVLGKLAGTEEVDFAAKQLNTDLYRRRQEEKSLAAEIAGLEEQIKQLDYLPALAEKVTRLERLVAQVKAARERWVKLVWAKEKLQEVAERIRQVESIIRRWQNVEAAAQTVNEAESLIAKKEAVCQKRREWFITEEVIKQNIEIIRRWQDLAQAEEKFFAAANAVDLRQRFVKLKDNLGRTQAAVNSAEGIIVKLAEIEQAGETVFAAEEKAGRRKLLSGAREKLQRIDSDIELAADIRRCWLGISEAESLLQRIGTAAAQKEKIAALACKLNQSNILIQKFRNNIVVWENRIGELEGAYRNQLAALGICPLCGSKIQKLKEAI